MTNNQIKWALQQIEKGKSRIDIAKELDVDYRSLTYSLRKVLKLKVAKQNALQVATQLRYSNAIKERIKIATSEYEIDRALHDGRNKIW